MIWTTIYNCFFGSRQTVTNVGPLQLVNSQATRSGFMSAQATLPNITTAQSTFSGFISAQVQPL